MCVPEYYIRAIVRGAVNVLSSIYLPSPLNAALLAESLEVVQRTSAVILGAITVEAVPEATPATEEPVAEVA